MLQRRLATGRSDTPLDIRAIAGLSGRLLFSEGYGRGRLNSIPCVVERVDRSEIRVNLIENNPHLRVESAVILEVTMQSALIQCFTTVRSRGQDTELRLRTPATPHIVQRRRFPRIDLFLSANVLTPENPITPLPAQIINLSVEGAACVLAEPINPGAEITLNLCNLALYPPEVRATVMRCTPTPSHLWVIGVQFQDLQPSQELYLGKYISDIISRSREEDS